MVSDAIIFHPTVAHYLRFLATTGKAYSVMALSILQILNARSLRSGPR